MTAGERMSRTGDALHADLRLRSVDVAFDLPLADAGVTVLFGPSGAGKTTVIRALAGLERIEAGEIRAGGEVWDDGGRRFVPARRRRVGLLFQDQALFPHLDVAANVAYGLRRMPRADRARRVAGALETCAVAGYERRAVPELSGGEAQRVALARALAPNPAILVADEPTGNLDEATGQQVIELLFAGHVERGTTLILVTHDNALAQRCDRIVRLRSGRIENSHTTSQTG
jgi:putative ABC transport system ATP-binding protein